MLTLKAQCLIVAVETQSRQYQEAMEARSHKVAPVHLLTPQHWISKLPACASQPDPALSLRTVTTAELLHADRQIWGTIVDLLHRKWSMDLP